MNDPKTGRTMTNAIRSAVAAALISGSIVAPAMSEEAQERQAAPATPAAAAPAPAELTVAATQVTADPIILAVREKLADAVRGAGEREDRQALAAFYLTRGEGPLWVTATGLSERGTRVVAEIAKADDWGLATSAFELPTAAPAGAPTTQRADAEIKIGLAVLKYARHARGGRLDPAQLSRYFDRKPVLRSPSSVLEAIATAAAPESYLRGLHPQHPQFEALRQALLKARGPKAAEVTTSGDGPDFSVKLPDGGVIKAGQEHASVALLRKRLGLAAGEAGKANVLDANLVGALIAFQRDQDISATGNLDRATRTALNKAQRPVASGNDEQRIIANMERWRWMPEDMGAFHVWDNIPEFTARVVKNGSVIHQARIVVGKPDTQTPLFSADMKYVVFHPGWGVPDSIKIKEILPYLRPQQSFFGFGETDTSVLKRHGLTVNLNGRPVDPSTINWQQTDIRRYSFVQPPGASNVLGELKFRFPNKHDVYMHDTSQRELFQKTVRAYSHGCVRIENPRKFAAILLDQDRGMPASEVERLLVSGPKDNQIELKATIPVHITYFTMMAEADGTMKTFQDYYGHDARVTAALAGRPMALEPNAVDTSEFGQRQQAARRPGVKQAQNQDFFAGLFGN